LTGATRWWLALDNDADEQAGKWEKWSARVQRIRPIDGNDITDFHQAGGDLRAWIEYHLENDAARLIEAGLPTPLAIRRYAEIADALGWPCQGAPWKEWADEVINDTRS
jgi:hypothetical protein